MQKLKELFIKYKEAILYVFFGGCSTMVNILTYTLATRWGHMNPYQANILAWIFAVIFAYITNKIWVFESKSMDLKVLGKELLSFFAARVLTLGLDQLVMVIGIEWLKANDIFVKVLANVLVIIANYFFSKFFIFKKEQ